VKEDKLVEDRGVAEWNIAGHTGVYIANCFEKIHKIRVAAINERTIQATKEWFSEIDALYATVKNVIIPHYQEAIDDYKYAFRELEVKCWNKKPTAQAFNALQRCVELMQEGVYEGLHQRELVLKIKPGNLTFGDKLKLHRDSVRARYSPDNEIK